MTQEDIKKRNQIFVGITATAIAYVAFLFFDFHSSRVPAMESERAERREKISGAEEELRRLNEFAKNIEVVKSEFRELNLQLESALEHMPRNFNFPSLLRRLNMLAQNSGVELSNFKPLKEDPDQNGPFFATVGIEVNLKGNFSQVLMFLDQMARLKRIVNVEKLKMRRVGDSTRRSSLETEVTLRTYRFSE